MKVIQTKDSSANWSQWTTNPRAEEWKLPIDGGPNLTFGIALILDGKPFEPDPTSVDLKFKHDEYE